MYACMYVHYVCVYTYVCRLKTTFCSSQLLLFSVLKMGAACPTKTIMSIYHSTEHESSPWKPHLLYTLSTVPEDLQGEKQENLNPTDMMKMF
jgi:hypothetical protein